NKDDAAGRALPRLLCVFSDRTRACWDAGRLGELHDLDDRIPPPPERLQAAADGIPALLDLLKELRQRLPPPGGRDYPEAALADQLQQLRDRAGAVSAEDYPDQAT